MVVDVLICPLCESVYPDGESDRCPQDGSPLYVIGDDVAARKALGPGDIVGKKYELLEEIGHRAGAGRTFRARQIQLEREVELRLLPENTITKPADHARFRREVETWGRLRNDHLVRLYDSGFAEGNAPYMALEYVQGGSAGDQLRQAHRFTVDSVRTIAQHILRALNAAHEANVLHRDITPDAIILSELSDGHLSCRLTGFGLAKHLGDDDDDPTAITMTGQVVGSPAYMAPETILRGVLEPRTDLYALGVTLYELLAAQRPFPGDSLADLLASHVQGVPEPLHLYRPDVPQDFVHFIQRLMEREPEARFQSAQDALTVLNASTESGSLDAWPSHQTTNEGSDLRERLLIGGMMLAIIVLVWLFSQSN